MADLSRRSFLGQALPFVAAAPAIVRVASLMKLPKPIHICSQWCNLHPSSPSLEDVQWMREQFAVAFQVPVWRVFGETDAQLRNRILEAI